MRPGQYTVLNSPDDLVIRRAVADLLYHAKVLECLETDFSAKIILHIDGMYDFVDVRDVAFAIYQASLKKAYGHYLITGHQIALKTLFAIMQNIAGRKKKAVVFTHWFIKMFLPLLEKRAYKKRKPPLFTRYSLYTLTSPSNFSHAKATRDLGYKPRPIYGTIKDNALWLIEQKKINHLKTLKYIIQKFKPQNVIQ